MYRFKCKKCSKGYNHQYNLNRHVRDIHRHIRFPCNYCQKTFITQKTLDNHINKNHTNYNYLCEICGVIFCSFYGLKNIKKPFTLGNVIFATFVIKILNILTRFVNTRKLLISSFDFIASVENPTM